MTLYADLNFLGQVMFSCHPKSQLIINWHHMADTVFSASWAIISSLSHKIKFMNVVNIWSTWKNRE